jgi:hypothetical protein
MAGDNRKKIMEAWRKEFAGCLVAHRAAHEAGDKGAAAAIVRKMKALQRAIGAYVADMLKPRVPQKR